MLRTEYEQACHIGDVEDDVECIFSQLWALGWLVCIEAPTVPVRDDDDISPAISKKSRAA